jgi:zinc protease
VAETVAVIRQQWQRLSTGGLTAAELADAKGLYLAGSFPLRLPSNRRLAAILAAMQLDRLGLHWSARRNGLIEAATLDDANRLAGTLLYPQSLIFVVAGQPQKLGQRWFCSRELRMATLAQ